MDNQSKIQYDLSLRFGDAGLQLRSDNHRARYERKDLDAWIFTDSSKIYLAYSFKRFDQISIQFKISNSNLSLKIC